MLAKMALSGLTIPSTLHAPIRLLALCVACLCILSFDGFTALLALFCLLSTGAANVLRSLDRSNTCALPNYWMSDEFTEDLSNVGMAGVGTLITLFILA